MGKPPTVFCLLTSVGETDSDSGVTLTGVKQATWGNLLKKFGSSLQLVKQIDFKKNIS